MYNTRQRSKTTREPVILFGLFFALIDDVIMLMNKLKRRLVTMIKLLLLVVHFSLSHIFLKHQLRDHRIFRSGIHLIAFRVELNRS